MYQIRSAEILFGRCTNVVVMVSWDGILTSEGMELCEHCGRTSRGAIAHGAFRIKPKTGRRQEIREPLQFKSLVGIAIDDTSVVSCRDDERYGG